MSALGANTGHTSAQSLRGCIQERIPNNYVFGVKLRNILVCQPSFAKYFFVVLA